MKSWIVALLLVCLSGCARYKMEDIKIVNASPRLGYDVVAVCDTCGEQSKCGSRNDSTVWANDHAKATGHKNFTRQSCTMGLTPVLRGPQEHTPAAATDGSGATPKTDWANPDEVLKTGMTLEQARTSLGDVGVTESETAADDVQRTVRFTQVGRGANAGSSRSVWAEFTNGRLASVKYGAWEKK